MKYKHFILLFILITVSKGIFAQENKDNIHDNYKYSLNQIDTIEIHGYWVIQDTYGSNGRPISSFRFGEFFKTDYELGKKELRNFKTAKNVYGDTLVRYCHTWNENDFGTYLAINSIIENSIANCHDYDSLEKISPSFQCSFKKVLNGKRYQSKKRFYYVTASCLSFKMNKKDIRLVTNGDYYKNDMHVLLIFAIKAHSQESDSPAQRVRIK